MEEKNLLLFFLGGEEFALDVRFVFEVLHLSQIHHIPQAPSFLEGVTNLKGSVVVVLDLSKKFHVESSMEERGKRLIVCRAGKIVAGLKVDSVSEVVSLNVKDIAAGQKVFSDSVKNIPIIGIARIGERLLPIIDLDKILNDEEAELLTKLK